MTQTDRTMVRVGEGIALGQRGQRVAAWYLLTDERVTRAGIGGSAAAFLPSLHLNIGDCYRRLGMLDAAKEHHRRGPAALPALVDGGAGSMVGEGLDRLGARLHGG